MTNANDRLFHMNDEYEMVEVTKEEVDPSWPNNWIKIRKSSDGLVSMSMDMANVALRDIIHAIAKATA